MTPEKKSKGFKNFQIWKNPAEERLFYPEDLNKILNFVSETQNPVRNTLIIMSLAKLGDRISELLEIKVSDINFEKRVIKVLRLKRRSVKRVYELVPLEPNLAFMMESYIKQNRLKDSDLLFSSPSSKTKSLTRQAVWYMIKKVGLKAGFTFTHPHVFRHNLVINMREKNVPLTVIQKIVGHSSVVTTAQYDKVTIGDMKNANETLWSN